MHDDDAADERWRVVSIIPWVARPNQWDVEFSPRYLQHARGMGGPTGRAVKGAKVRVNFDGMEFRVIDYTPPEKQISDLTEQDYRRKALERVRQELVTQ